MEKLYRAMAVASRAGSSPIRVRHARPTWAAVVLLLAGAATLAACSPQQARVWTVRAFITGYSYFDNTPPGSGRISHPVLHDRAGGRGTYDDPVTVAIGHRHEGGRDVLDWPAGTRFYVPNLRRYLIVEDTCGDGDRPQDGPCHTGYPAEASTWLDVWIGGEGGDERDAVSCMAALTGVWTVVIDPAANYAVEPGDIYSPATEFRPDGCSQQYGEALVRAT